MSEKKEKKEKKENSFMKAKKRSYFITINEGSYTDDICYSNLKNYVLENFKHVVYFCFGEEKGDSGNIHIHLYFELLNPLSFSSVLDTFRKCDVEIRKGNPSQARNYVLKPEGMIFSDGEEEKSHTVLNVFQEWGDFSKYEKIKARGSAELDLNDKLSYYVDNYNSVSEVADVDLWFAKMFRSELQERFLKKTVKDFRRKNGIEKNGVVVIDRPVYYISGDSRVGKTFAVKKNHGQENVFVANMSKENPFDAYDLQPILLLDEFRSSMKITELLGLLDVYDDYTLPARYNDKLLLAEKIYITTNWEIEEQYQAVQEDHPKDFQALKNRIINGWWVMLFNPFDSRRYIACKSTEKDFSPGARQMIDLEKLPFDPKNGYIYIDFQTFTAMSDLIKCDIEPTPEALDLYFNPF
jgi:hypothetical protein